MARIKLSEHMTHETKKDNGVWWGILLIAVGAALLLHNFGLIRWNWYALWQAWPVLLLILGVHALDMDERAKRIIIAVVIALAVFWAVEGFGPHSRMMPQDRIMMRFPGNHLYWR